MRSLKLAPLVAASCALGCVSAYDSTYEQETRRLEGQQSAREQREEMAHAEASR